ncbi:signal peptide containing protein [Theileria equi strain WA]|uniref:Signal peptide containing protein n=1 Tax=Theileria equi strain WA TaxID=1537102 RepID=L1LBB4_THEEQ|nr:signal peptide containing protein [Theileria equi strain WA]EKX72621.1 signal peptide containing protein [Theileria equi strain WA]|eukprot:XP_004832073.1 signal peptide containing protein [Theileria equi strain WA]
MRILALLWTVCLVRLCSGCIKGNETDYNDGPYGGSEENLRSSPPQSAGQDGLVLDLASPDKSKVKIEIDNDKGVTLKTYFPKKGYYIMHQVVDGDKELWTASEGEGLLFAEVSSKGNYSVLILILKNGDRKYFEKNADGEWKKITEENYDKKLQDLKNSLNKKLAKDKGQHESISLHS